MFNHQLGMLKDLGLLGNVTILMVSCKTWKLEFGILIYQFVKNAENSQDWNLTSQISATRENPVYNTISWGNALKPPPNELPVYYKRLLR